MKLYDLTSRNSENSAIFENSHEQFHNEEEPIINELEINTNNSRANKSSEEGCCGNLSRMELVSDRTVCFKVKIML